MAFYKFSQNLGFSKGFENFTTTQNISWNHYNIKVCKKDCSQGCFQKIQYFAKVLFLQLLLESWYSVLRKGLGNFTAAFSISQYHYNFKAPQKICSQGYLQKNYIIICEISHFTTFARILVFNPYKRIEQLCKFIIPWYHYYGKASQKAWSYLQKSL